MSVIGSILFLTILTILNNPIKTQSSYPCSVNNCQSCFYYNLCGLCNTNYILQINTNNSLPYCAPVNLTLANCQESLGNNICEKCQPGYYISNIGTCVPGETSITCPGNCLNCTDAMSCQLCEYGYNVQMGFCVRNIPSLDPYCQIAFYPTACQLCTPGYIVGFEYQCTPITNFTCTIENCFTCFGNSSNCSKCLTSYQLTGSGNCQPIQCQISNCLTCSNISSCDACNTNYYYDEKDNVCLLKSYGCNVSNCLGCVGPNQCGMCADGYYLKEVMGQAPYSYKYCVPLTSANLATQNTQYCNQYGTVLLQSASLTYGCVQCMDGFISIEGVCVANLAQSQYSCNIQNCIFCISNNYCGQCQDGYTVYAFTGGICAVIYSPLPNCKIASGSTCNVCNDGYIAVSGDCQKINENVVCQLSGCSYCTGNNTCAQCMTGYKQKYIDSQVTMAQSRRRLLVDQLQTDNSTNCTGADCNNNGTDDGNNTDNNKTNTTKQLTCIQMCNIQNCYQCKNSQQCLICLDGYSLQNQNMQCLLGAQSLTAEQCSNRYGQNCTACNMNQCTQCVQGYSSMGGYCCQNVEQNMLGCVSYQSNCGIQCVECERGYLLVQGLCVRYPCEIENCNYCFRSSFCIVCAEGFTLNPSTNVCEVYTVQGNNCPDNCIACNENGCQTCLNGYQIYQGYCVCNFQNCLQCLGNQVCTRCANPLMPSLITNDGGCIPIIMPATLCNINNCFQCSSQNVCGMCDPGFSETSNGICIQNNCSSMTNCELCSLSQQICFLCEPGYMQSLLLGSECESVPNLANYSCQVMGCALCETSTTCSICHEMYNLNSNKTCSLSQCTQNCMICIHNNACLACQSGFYLNTNLACQQLYPNNPNNNNCSIASCLSCSLQYQYINQTTNIQVEICNICALGFLPSSDYQTCQPQSCMTPNCQICVPGSALSHYICLVCQQGYFMNSYLQCVQYSPAVNTSVCNVYNCIYCYSDNKCGMCVDGWLPINGLCQTQNYCNVGNCSMCTTINNCSQCLTNYSITAQSVNGQQQNYCTINCQISFCDICESATTCKMCTQTYQLSANKGSCSCPDTYKTNSSGLCACPPGLLEYQSSICITCTIPYCLSCSQANICAICPGNFTLPNTTCICPPTFSIINNSCMCAPLTTLSSTSNTCVSCNVANCGQCDTANICKMCAPSYALNLSSNQCLCPSGTTQNNNYCYVCNQTLVPNCQLCSANNFCSLCQTTFLLQNATGQCYCPLQTTLNTLITPPQCIQCQRNGCSLCQTPNNCSVCLPQYTPYADICLSCAISSCKFCLSDNYCAQCKNGLLVSASGDSCVTCNTANCALCSSNDVCAECAEGFEFDVSSQFCVDCANVQGCSVCSANNLCAQCLMGYTQVNGTCQLCSFPCSTCNADGSCATCQQPYSTSATSSGVCYTCSVANCITCTFSNTLFCQQCAPGFQTVNGTCQKQCNNSLCTNCNSTACTSCIQGYTPIGLNCILCQNSPICQSCQSSNTSICTACNDGYYLLNGKCKACPSSNCKKCTSTQCTEFKQTTKQFAITINNQIVPAICDPGCDKCSKNNVQVCINCMEGYSKNSDSLCVPCDTACKTCMSNQPTSCLSCYGTAFLSGNACVSCSATSNCLTCKNNSLSVCTSCPYGYNLNSNNTCQLGCPQNCLACENGKCTLCMEGYSLNSKAVCLPCLSNCRGCSSQANGVCISCGQGFFINPQGVCSSCPIFCKSCTSASCTQCLPGYTLTSTFQCARTCLAPCATCSNTNPKVCQSCIAGYIFNNSTSQCQQVTSCQNGVCVVCPLGYVLNQGSCLKCTGQNCARCTNTSSTQCSSCIEGFYLSSQNMCVSCPIGCISCSSSKKCTACQAEYTLPASPVQQVQICIACQSPCLTCSSTPNTCTSCISSFSLVGWKCVSNFNFGFNVTLSVDPQEFYQNYEAFLDQIVSAVNGTNVNIVTMSNIVKGSTVASGNIDSSASPGSDGAQQQQNALNNLFNSNNGQIGGMPVQSSQIVVNGDTSNNNNNDNSNSNNNNDNKNNGTSSSSSVNLGLILGICIPLGIIVIAALVYFLCFRQGTFKGSSGFTGNPTGNIRQEFEMGQI